MAQRLIDAARFERRLMFTVDRDEICDDCMLSFLNEMAQEPTIDPVKHGRWKEITYHNGCTPDYDCVCSECGTSGVPYYEYCPGCGARMDADE